jgi:hypothetical protein
MGRRKGVVASKKSTEPVTAKQQQSEPKADARAGKRKRRPSPAGKGISSSSSSEPEATPTPPSKGAYNAAEHTETSSDGMSGLEEEDVLGKKGKKTAIAKPAKLSVMYGLLKDNNKLLKVCFAALPCLHACIAFLARIQAFRCV